MVLRMAHTDEQPILADHHTMAGITSSLDEVIVKIDNNEEHDMHKDNNLWRNSRYEFLEDSNGNIPRKTSDVEPGNDPPSKLITQFLYKQKAAEISLDPDFDICDNHRVSMSKGTRVSFSIPIENEDSSNEDRTSGKSSNIVNNCENNQVLKCTSFQRKGSFLLGRSKTNSRMVDSNETPDRNTNTRSRKVYDKASGMLKTKINEEEEEDDSFSDEDLPEEYRKDKLNALIILQWIILLLIVTALICTLTISKWKTKSFRGLKLWKWEVMGLVLICGRLVSGWGIRLVVVVIERNFLLRKRVLYFVYGVRKAVQNCIWLGLVLIAWQYMFDKKVEVDNKFLHKVNKLMVCLLIGTLLWLVKTLIVKVLASSFHVSTFFDRIQVSLFNQYVIETLSGPALIADTSPPELKTPVLRRGPTRGSSFKISGTCPKTKDNPGITINQLHRLNPKNVSAWNMKRLMKLVRHGSLSTLDEQISNTTQGNESSTQIRNECEAKVAARKIFQNLAKPGSTVIILEDLKRFLRKEEAEKTMSLVSESENISKALLKNWVVNAFRERRALALTLNDTKTAVNKLHHMVNGIVGFLVLVISLVILEIATTKYLVALSSQLVVVAFIFGNSCKTVFEAIIFVFVMHPFDVGDRCEIDGVQMMVEEMNILTTVFLRWDYEKIIFPNTTLATRPIGNYYRSPDMGDTVDFSVHIATPPETIALIKERITSYIESKKEHWYPSPSVVSMNFDDLNKIKLSVWIRHTMNFQNMGERWKRRAVLVEEMAKIFKDLDIKYRLYPVNVDIKAMPPITSNRMPSTWESPLMAS